jgi:hypothetical protein
MSSFEILSQEVKHRRKNLINQHPVILEPNIRKIFQLFFENRIKILYNVFERKDSTIPFFAFFEWFQVCLSHNCGSVLTRVKKPHLKEYKHTWLSNMKTQTGRTLPPLHIFKNVLTFLESIWRKPLSSIEVFLLSQYLNETLY